jgi:hypothetical protein
MRHQESRYDRLPTIDPIQVGRPKLQLRNPVLADGGEVLDWTYYDFFSCALNTLFNQRQILFSKGVGTEYTPVGGSAFSKTFLHTNVEGSGGLLPNGYKIDVQALRLVVDQGIQFIDLNDLLYMTLATFNIGQKQYFQAPYGNLPGGVGAVLSAAPDIPVGGTGVTLANGPLNCNGWPGNLRGVYSLSAGLEASIDYGQNFNFTVDPTQGENGSWSTQPNTDQPPGVGFRAWQHLDGILTRPTQ